MLDLKSHRVCYHLSTRVLIWRDFSMQQQVKEAALDGRRSIQSTCIHASELTHARETASQLSCTFSRGCAQHTLQDNWVLNTHTHAHSRTVTRSSEREQTIIVCSFCCTLLGHYACVCWHVKDRAQTDRDGCLENFNIHVQPIAHTHTEGLSRAVEDRRTDSVCAITFTHGLCHI